MIQATSLDDLADSANLFFAQSDDGIYVVQTPEPTKQESSEQSETNKGLAEILKQLQEIRICLHQRPRSQTSYRRRRSKSRTPSRERRYDQPLSGFIEYLAMKPEIADLPVSTHRLRETKESESSTPVRMHDVIFSMCGTVGIN